MDIEKRSDQEAKDEKPIVEIESQEADPTIALERAREEFKTTAMKLKELYESEELEAVLPPEEKSKFSRFREQIKESFEELTKALNVMVSGGFAATGFAAAAYALEVGRPELAVVMPILGIIGAIQWHVLSSVEMRDEQGMTSADWQLRHEENVRSTARAEKEGIENQKQNLMRKLDELRPKIQEE